MSNLDNPAFRLIAIVLGSLVTWQVLEQSCISADLPYCDLQVQPTQQQEATK